MTGSLPALVETKSVVHLGLFKRISKLEHLLAERDAISCSGLGQNPWKMTSFFRIKINARPDWTKSCVRNRASLLLRYPPSAFRGESFETFSEVPAEHDAALPAGSLFRLSKGEGGRELLVTSSFVWPWIKFATSDPSTLPPVFSNFPLLTPSRVQTRTDPFFHVANDQRASAALPCLPLGRATSAWFPLEYGFEMLLQPSGLVERDSFSPRPPPPS